MEKFGFLFSYTNSNEYLYDAKLIAALKRGKARIFLF